MVRKMNIRDFQCVDVAYFETQSPYLPKDSE